MANTVLSRKYSGQRRPVYRSPWEITADTSGHVVPPGKRNAVAAAPYSTYRPVGNGLCAVRRLPQLWNCSQSRVRFINIVLPRKKRRLPQEISGLAFNVLPGNPYRHLGEALPSWPGTNIVLPGKTYRLLREALSSRLGKVAVLPRKYRGFYLANGSFLSRGRIQRPVIVYVRCLLCFYAE